MISQRTNWGEYFNGLRTERKLTRRAASKMFGVDPALITLIERDGHIPRRKIVIAIARGLKADLEETLLHAGYLPDTITPTFVMEHVHAKRAKKSASSCP